MNLKNKIVLICITLLAGSESYSSSMASKTAKSANQKAAQYLSRSLTTGKKALKNFMKVCGAICLFCETPMSDSLLELESQVAPCTDPKIIEFFDVIRQDSGIKEHIPLYTTSINTLKGRYVKRPQVVSSIIDPSRRTLGVAINLTNVGYPEDLDIVDLKHTMAHELEHVKQFTKHASSLDPEKLMEADENWLFKIEEGAEDASMKYSGCDICLNHAQNITGYNQKCKDLGYYGAKEIEPYRQKAAQEKLRCPAHAYIEKDYQALQNKTFWERYDELEHEYKQEHQIDFKKSKETSRDNSLTYVHPEVWEKTKKEFPEEQNSYVKKDTQNLLAYLPALNRSNHKPFHINSYEQDQAPFKLRHPIQSIKQSLK